MILGVRDDPIDRPLAKELVLPWKVTTLIELALESFIPMERLFDPK